MVPGGGGGGPYLLETVPDYMKSRNPGVGVGHSGGHRPLPAVGMYSLPWVRLQCYRNSLLNASQAWRCTYSVHGRSDR